MATTDEKKVFAKVGETIFSYINSGKWEATLNDREVILERLGHLKWECRDKFNNELLGEGTTRNMAMREAFFEQAIINGYDAKEAVRLDWVLEEQKYRSYGGHRPRKSGVKSNRKTKASREKVVNLDNHKNELRDHAASSEQDSRKAMNAPEDHNHIGDEFDAALSVERLKRNIDHYRTAYNDTLGGFVYYKRDGKGRMVGGLKGPFTTEKELFDSILSNEMVSNQ